MGCLSVCVQVAAEGKEGERERERRDSVDGVCVHGGGNCRWVNVVGSRKRRRRRRRRSMSL